MKDKNDENYEMSIDELIEEIGYMPEKSSYRQAESYFASFDRKYGSNPLIADWLKAVWPSTECFIALTLPMINFLDIQYLLHGDKWEEQMARDLVKEESRSRLKGLDGEEREETIQELRLKYKEEIPKLQKHEIERYAKSRPEKGMSYDEMKVYMIRFWHLVCLKIGMEEDKIKKILKK